MPAQSAAHDYRIGGTMTEPTRQAKLEDRRDALREKAWTLLAQLSGYKRPISEKAYNADIDLLAGVLPAEPQRKVRDLIVKRSKLAFACSNHEGSHRGN